MSLTLIKEQFIVNCNSVYWYTKLKVQPKKDDLSTLSDSVELIFNYCWPIILAGDWFWAWKKLPAHGWRPMLYLLAKLRIEKFLRAVELLLISYYIFSSLRITFKFDLIFSYPLTMELSSGSSNLIIPPGCSKTLNT